MAVILRYLTKSVSFGWQLRQRGQTNIVYDQHVHRPQNLEFRQ